MARDLSAFLGPRRVAVVGAGERPTSSGGAVLHMMRRSGYAGEIVPVNPRGGTILGIDAATSLRAIERPADLVVIVVRPDLIPGIVAEAAETGHRNLLILPGGFAEAGEEGRLRDEKLRAAAAEAGITIAGPNCAGLIHLDRERPFAATFLRALPPGGGVAVVSQSGAVAEEVIAAANRETLPLGTVVSVGNALHLGVADYLDDLGRRDGVSAILLYIESLPDPERFGTIARRVAARKPIVALFGGRTIAGGRAAAAHTGAGATDDAAIERFCRDCGIVRATSLRRLLLAAKGFGFYPEGIGGRVLVLSNSGGPGVLCTDRAALEGLDLPPLPAPLSERLKAFLPPEASIANPLDLLADAREDRFGDALAAALAHAAGHYDAILMIHVAPFMVDVDPVVDRLAAGARDAPVPVLHGMMGTLPDKARWFRTMEAVGVAMFDDVEAMAECAGLLARYRTLRADIRSLDGAPA